MQYLYDPENRLTQAKVQASGVTATYSYDPAGRRMQKQVAGSSGTVTTQFLSAGDDEIADYDGSGTLQQRYIPGRAVDQPIAIVTAAGVKLYFHQDKVGSTVAMSDASGAKAKGPYTYDPYGNCLSGGVDCVTLDDGVPYKFTGRRLDRETGLYYYRARFYSPALGRFLQTDPIGYKDDINLYAYVGNDPTDKVDPSGLGPDDASAGGCPVVFGGCIPGGADLNSLHSKDTNGAGSANGWVRVADVTVNDFDKEVGRAGHVGVGVGNDASEGYYPRDTGVGTKLLEGLAASVPGAVKHDDMSQHHRSHTIHTSKEQDAKMRAYIQERRNNPGEYRLWAGSRNCKDFARSVLQAGGVTTTDATLPNDWYEENFVKDKKQ